MVSQMLEIVSSKSHSFPSGSKGRQAVCYKLVDVLYLLSLRIGFDMTREYMTDILKDFFAIFNLPYAKDVMRNSQIPEAEINAAETTNNGTPNDKGFQ